MATVVGERKESESLSKNRDRLIKTKDMLINVSLNLQKLISIIYMYVRQYFLLKKLSEAFAVQKLHSIFQKNIPVYLVVKSYNT